MIKGYLLPRAGIRKLKDALDAYALRHRVTAENVANAQTPGYRSKMGSSGPMNGRSTSYHTVLAARSRYAEPAEERRGG